MERDRRTGWNRGIDLIRVGALFAVVLPHFSPLPPQGRSYPLYYALIDTFGSLGVPVFFILSGYLFRSSLSRPFAGMIRRRYIVPWLTASLVMFFLGALVKGDPLTVFRLGGIIIGYHSIYYFLFLLLIFEVSTWLLVRRGVPIKFLFVASLALGLIGGILTSRILIGAPTGVFEVSRFFTYLNPVAFYVYYALGLFLSEAPVRKRLLTLPGTVGVAAFVFFAAKYLETFFLVRNGHYSLVYFSPLSVTMGISAAFVIFNVFVYADAVPKCLSGFSALGRYVLPVYLYHLVAVNALNRLLLRMGLPMVPFHLLGTVLVVVFSCGFFALAERCLPEKVSRVALGITPARPRREDRAGPRKR